MFACMYVYVEKSQFYVYIFPSFCNGCKVELRIIFAFHSIICYAIV